MSRNPDARYFRAASREYFNKFRDAVDPSHTDLTNGLIYRPRRRPDRSLLESYIFEGPLLLRYGAERMVRQRDR